MIKLRDYQKECIDSIPESGNYLIQMATGLGKTATFTNIPRRGRILVLAHREELINQPIKYYNCPVGVEMADRKSNGEEVVIASIASLVRRLEKFDPNEFDTVIVDECHHAAANSYKKILSYFQPRLRLGFTATPTRGDKVRLDDVFSRIIFQRDIKWAIKNKYLCDIHCLRVNINYDLSQVSRRMGDYAVNELDEALNTEVLNKAIAEAYREHGKGQTLIFAISVEHAQNIAKEIPGAVAVTAETKNRSEIIEKFTRREIPVLVNCMIFTEGTDIPLVETVIIARPTSNESLYQQMVGRGLRLHPDKEKLILIDVVGTTGRCNICTAPTLLGLDLETVPKNKQDEIQGDLFDLPDLITKQIDCIESWIRNVEFVDLWAKEQNYNTHNVNYFRMPDGSFIVNLPHNFKIKIDAPDELCRTNIHHIEGKIDNLIYYNIEMQEALDSVYSDLREDYQPEELLWNLNKTKYWGKQPASEKQINLIKRRYKGDLQDLSKFEASQILNRLFAR